MLSKNEMIEYLVNNEDIQKIDLIDLDYDIIELMYDNSINRKF